jgi:hypothetical protein
MVRKGSEALRWAALAGLVGAAMAVAACSGGGGHSTPTGVQHTTGSAAISGTVTSGNRPAGGVTVTIDGQMSSTQTDPGGRFALDGVAAGDRTLTFSTTSGQAALEVRGVEDNEEIEVEVEVSGSHATLKSMHRGPRGTVVPLTLAVDPASWNTNWSRSAGTVTVFLRGTGYDQIDPASVALLGDDPSVAPLAARTARIEGDHLRATFGKADAFALLLAPVAPGQSRTIEVDALEAGQPVALTATVRVVGPAH